MKAILKKIGIVLVLILVVIILAGSYLLFSQRYPEQSLAVVKHKEDTHLSDEVVYAALIDPQAKIFAKGDVDGDGFEDAIALETQCGASCGTRLTTIFNTGHNTAKRQEIVFPSYIDSGAAHTEIQTVSIENHVVSLTGSGFANSDWNTFLTKRYVLERGAFVELDVPTQTASQASGSTTQEVSLPAVVTSPRPCVATGTCNEVAATITEDMCVPHDGERQIAGAQIISMKYGDGMFGATLFTKGLEAFTQGKSVVLDAATSSAGAVGYAQLCLSDTACVPYGPGDVRIENPSGVYSRVGEMHLRFTVKGTTFPVNARTTRPLGMCGDE